MMKRCLKCGKINIDTCQCNLTSLDEVTNLLKEKSTFRSWKEASEFLKKDFRTLMNHFSDQITIKKEKDLSKLIIRTCKFCNTQYPQIERRSNICKKCSLEGKSVWSRSQILKEKYKGENNPNYRKGFRVERNKGRCWTRSFRYQNSITNCEISNCLSTLLDGHHILSLDYFPEFGTQPWNIIFIDRLLHIELHQKCLDLLLLPSLFELVQDAHQLKEVYLNLLQAHNIHPQYVYGPPRKGALVASSHPVYRKTHPDYLECLKYVDPLKEKLSKYL